MSNQRDVKKKIPTKKYILKIGDSETIPVNLNLVKRELTTSNTEISSSPSKLLTSTSRFIVSPKKDEKPSQKSSKKCSEKTQKTRRRIFNSDEELKLLSIIGGEGKGKGFSDILNSTSNTSHYKMMKERAWTLIYNEWASLVSKGEVNDATIEQLKTKWDNLKRRAGKNLADEKAYRKGTGGGGEPSTMHVSAVDNKTINLLGDRIAPMTFPFDSDGPDHHFDAGEKIIQMLKKNYRKVFFTPQKDTQMCKIKRSGLEKFLTRYKGGGYLKVFMFKGKG